MNTNICNQHNQCSSDNVADEKILMEIIAGLPGFAMILDWYQEGI